MSEAARVADTPMPPEKWLRMKAKLEEVAHDPEVERSFELIEDGLERGFYDVTNSASSGSAR